MSPRKIDKNEKRKEVAKACADLMLDVGVKNLTVAQVASTAGIGKGTVYEYFKSKDDIVFEIINIYIEQYHIEFLKDIEKETSTKKKVSRFFKFVLDNGEDNMRMFNGYKEYLSVCLADNNDKMSSFNKQTDEFFSVQLERIIKEGVDKGELIEESLDLTKGLLTYKKGLCLFKMTQNDYDVSVNYNNFMNTIFKLITTNKDNK